MLQTTIVPKIITKFRVLLGVTVVLAAAMIMSPTTIGQDTLDQPMEAAGEQSETTVDEQEGAGASAEEDGVDADANPTDEVEAAPLAPALPRKEFNSPRATMFTFLNAMGEYADGGNNEAISLATAIESLQWPDDMEISPESQDRTIRMLWGVLNRLGEVKNLYLPSQWQTDRQNLDTYQYYPIITAHIRNTSKIDSAYEEFGGSYYFPPVADAAPSMVIEFSRTANNEWRFSEDTISQVADWYNSVLNLPIRYGKDERTASLHLMVRSLFPLPLRQTGMFGVEHWQWLGLFGLILIGMILDFLLGFILRSLVKAIIKKRGAHASNETIQSLVRPLGLLAAGLLWLSLLPSLGMPEAISQILQISVNLIVIVAGVWAAFRSTDLLAEALASRASETATKFDDLLVPLIGKSMKVFITAFGLIYMADTLHIEILPLLTGLGIGGAAIAFASKDTIENFFGSIAVIVDRPFEVGDWVQTNDVEGTVESMGFRSTRIRTFYNSLITVPNSNLVRAIVDNYGQRKYRRYKSTLSLTYSTRPERIDAFCEGVRELIRLHPYTRKDYYHVWLKDFAGSSLDVMLYMFFETPEWGTELRERHRFMLDVIRLADSLGVEFAFPTQTLHLHQEEAVEDSPMPFVSSATPTPGSEEGRSRRMGATTAQRMVKDASWRFGIQPPPVEYGSVPLDMGDDDDDESQIEDRTSGG